MTTSNRLHIPRVNFVIPGAQKSGTTALREKLSLHPDLFIQTKEQHFFDNEAIDWTAPNYALYEKFADGAGPNLLVGEQTPIYMFWKQSIARIHNYNPKMKLIVILRNPVDRAYSQWKMLTARGVEIEDFSFAIREGRSRVQSIQSNRVFSYVERGFYTDQIRRILGAFPKCQVLFLLNDNLFREPENLLDRVCDFLNIQHFKEYPLPNIIRPALVIQNSNALNVDAIPAASPEDRAYLAGLYRPDIIASGELMGIDLSHWL